MSALEIGTVIETSSAVSLRHRGRLVVLAATLAMAMGFGGLGLVSVFMTPMEADLGWTRSNTSLGYAIAATGMAVGGLFWGRVADRVDVRLLLVTGGAGMVASLHFLGPEAGSSGANGYPVHRRLWSQEP